MLRELRVAICYMTMEKDGQEGKHPRGRPKLRWKGTTVFEGPEGLEDHGGIGLWKEDMERYLVLCNVRYVARSRRRREVRKKDGWDGHQTSTKTCRKLEVTCSCVPYCFPQSKTGFNFK